MSPSVATADIEASQIFHTLVWPNINMLCSLGTIHSSLCSDATIIFSRHAKTTNATLNRLLARPYRVQAFDSTLAHLACLRPHSLAVARSESKSVYRVLERSQ